MKKINAFTLVELMVVITVILILATFVSLSLVNAKKKARDEKRVTDVNNIASALDQYALDNKRLYPAPAGCADTDCVYTFGDPSGSIESQLTGYLSPFPKDPLSSEPEYGYEYKVSQDRQRAVIAIKKFEIQTSLCNLKRDTIASTIPDLAAEYLNKVTSLDYCYFIAK